VDVAGALAGGGRGAGREQLQAPARTADLLGRFKSPPSRNLLPEQLSGHSRARKIPPIPRAVIRGLWGWNALHPQNDPGHLESDLSRC
jgi:hypothetical protein